MANPDHLALLRAGVPEWNLWRLSSPDVLPDLTGADFSRANLCEAILIRADLSGADFSQADLSRANLSGANLRGANLGRAVLIRANLSGANLTHSNLTKANLIRADLGEAKLVKAKLIEATLIGADLRQCDLGGADLSKANLIGASLVRTKLRKANLTGCFVYGLSAWDVELEGAIQSELVIAAPHSPRITIDSLEVAQFIYLLLNNRKIRQVIDTITSKIVLILGRFTPERKAVLDAIRDELRKRDYLPVLFDFEKPSNRDITETISTLAHMARFVIADITDAKSIPQELMKIVPALPSVPVQPLLLASQREYGMFEHLRRFPWVLEPFVYDDQDEFLRVLAQKVTGPAEAMLSRQTVT